MVQILGKPNVTLPPCCEWFASYRIGLVEGNLQRVELPVCERPSIP
jgi:hypothetical protein